MGDGVGPGRSVHTCRRKIVHVCTDRPSTPVYYALRRHGNQFSIPIRIGDDVWIGSNVVVQPGVTIGKNSVIGAGSVVTKVIPENVVAVGSPCRVLRQISERDKEYYYKNMKV
jgi:galactoside O-acetyltransferase